MLKLLQAHRLEAGPTQRPLLAGAMGGMISALPALAVLIGFRSLDAPAMATGISVFAAGLTFTGLMLLGGVLYGWLFQRAANEPRGGWLFGLAFGFVLWMLGPVPLLQWLPEQPILRGYPAAGLLLAQLLWGLSLGVVFPPSTAVSTSAWRTDQAPHLGPPVRRRRPRRRCFGRCHHPGAWHPERTCPSSSDPVREPLLG